MKHGWSAGRRPESYIVACPHVLSSRVAESNDEPQVIWVGWGCWFRRCGPKSHGQAGHATPLGAAFVLNSLPAWLERDACGLRTACVESDGCLESADRERYATWGRHCCVSERSHGKGLPRCHTLR